MIVEWLLMRKKWGVVFIAGTLIFAVIFSVAIVGAMGTGAVEMTMTVGNQGEVWFPHQQHQKMLCDCNLCQDLFPQVAVSI